MAAADPYKQHLLKVCYDNETRAKLMAQFASFYTSPTDTVCGRMDLLIQIGVTPQKCADTNTDCVSMTTDDFQRIKLWQNSNLYLKWVSDDVGLGVFSNSMIRKGAPILIFGGMVVTKIEHMAPPAEPKYAHHPVNYDLLIWQDPEIYLQMWNTGNIGRFVNHDCTEPNTKALLMLVGETLGEAAPTVCPGLVAIRDIAEDTEITFDYGRDSASNGGIQAPCHCPTCVARGVVGKLFSETVPSSTPQADPIRTFGEVTPPTPLEGPTDDPFDTASLMATATEQWTSRNFKEGFQEPHIAKQKPDWKIGRTIEFLSEHAHYCIVAMGQVKSNPYIVLQFVSDNGEFLPGCSGTGYSTYALFFHLKTKLSSFLTLFVYHSNKFRFLRFSDIRFDKWSPTSSEFGVINFFFLIIKNIIIIMIN